MKNTKLVLALLMITMLTLNISAQAGTQGGASLDEVDGVMMPNSGRMLNFESVFTVDNLLEQVPVDLSVAGKPLAAVAAGVVTLFGVKGLWAFWDALTSDEPSFDSLINNRFVNKATSLGVQALPYSPGLVSLPLFRSIDNALYKRTVLGMYEGAYKLFVRVAKEIADDNTAGLVFTQKDRVLVEAQLRFRNVGNALTAAQDTFSKQADDLAKALALVKQALKKATDDEEVNACVDLKKAIELLFKTVNERRVCLATAVNIQTEKQAQAAVLAARLGANRPVAPVMPPMNHV